MHLDHLTRVRHLYFCLSLHTKETSCEKDSPIQLPSWPVWPSPISCSPEVYASNVLSSPLFSAFLLYRVSLCIQDKPFQEGIIMTQQSPHPNAHVPEWLSPTVIYSLPGLIALCLMASVWLPALPALHSACPWHGLFRSSIKGAFTSGVLSCSSVYHQGRNWGPAP